MNSNLIHLVLRTSALIPYVYQFATRHEHQIQVSYRLAAITNGAHYTRGVLHKIEFVLFVAMSRIVKNGLVAFAYIEDI